MSKQNVKFSDYYDNSNSPWSTQLQFRFIYVFDDFEGKNYFCITKDDLVYGFGCNSSGCLGFNHNNRVPEPTLIEELCSKKICSVFRGQNHMIARNDKNEIYCWGHNTCGQLGIGIIKQSSIYSPKLNNYLSQRDIIEISCGSNHSLGLSSSGEVYAWGNNDQGQIGCASANRFHSKPVKLNFFRNKTVKTICCGSNHSVIMTHIGQVFAWGDNGYGQLGIGSDEDLIRSPKPVDLSQLTDKVVNRIVCSKFSTYFLTSDKNIYFYGTTDQTDNGELNKLSNNTRINDINIVHHCHKGYIFTAQTDYKIYEIVESWKHFEKHDYNNCVEFYGKRYKITHKLVDLEYKPRMFSKSTQTLGTILKSKSFDNVLKAESQSKELSFETFESRFRNIHEIKDQIGTGTFGTVYKVKHVLDNQVYAVKKIMNYDVTNEMSLLEDLKSLTKLDHNHLTNYYSVWMEDEECLYIQMEFCETNLRNVIADNNNVFNESNSVSKTIEYFISCEILKELLKGLKYLHSTDPVLIHGNLNSHNVLITFSNIGKSFIKLGGYGLAKYKLITENPTTDEHRSKHIAPEVLKDEYFDTKSDIYSLGVICQELFQNTIENHESNTCADKIENIHRLIDSMLLYPNCTDRPSALDIQSCIDDWTVKWQFICKTYPINDLRSVFLKLTDNIFLYTFLSVKTGKGFDKIVLNKTDVNTSGVSKNQISSVYRSNSVSKHWKKVLDSLTEIKDYHE